MCDMLKVGSQLNWTELYINEEEENDKNKKRIRGWVKGKIKGIIKGVRRYGDEKGYTSNKYKYTVRK